MYKSWELISFALFVVGLIAVGVAVRAFDRRFTADEAAEVEEAPVVDNRPSRKSGQHGTAGRKKRKHGR